MEWQAARGGYQLSRGEDNPQISFIWSPFGTPNDGGYPGAAVSKGMNVFEMANKSVDIC